MIGKGWGVNIHRLRGADVNPSDLDTIVNAGFTFVSEDIRWSEVEKVKGEYDFSGFDALMAALSERGLRPLYFLDYGNLLYEDERRAVRTEEGRQAFAAFSAAAAGRYAGKGVIWQIWNEPNLSNFWHPEPNIDDYFSLVQLAVESIRDADPAAVITAPGSTIDLGFLEGLFQRGLLDLVDGVSVNPFRAANAPETAAPGYGDLWKRTGALDLPPDLGRVEALIAKYAPAGKSIPIVFTGWGYPGDPQVSFGGDSLRTLQGRYLPRAFLVSLWLEVPVMQWFNLNDPPDPEGNALYGLISGDGMPKPAYNAARTLMVTLDGFEYDRRIEIGSPYVFVLRFTDNGQNAYAMWTASAAREVTLPLPPGSGRLVSIFGNERAVTWDTDGLSVRITGDPRYLVVNAR